MADNEEISLRNLFTYINKIFKIDEKLGEITDNRKRHSISLTVTLTIVLVGFLMQKPSFYQIFTQGNFQKRMEHLFKKGTKLPDIDAARDMLESIPSEELTAVNAAVVKKIRKNKVFSEGTIAGLTVVAIDGVELFNSEKKCCGECLERTKRNGATEYFHRSVVCMTVGSDPHVILGEEMLKPRDGNAKDEGEITGGKRLVENLYKRHKHFADVIVADALYLNAPFINTVLNKKMDIVIRAVDEKRLILQDALGLIKNKKTNKIFDYKKKTVEAWSDDHMTMDGVEQELRFFQFREHTKLKDGTEKVRTLWVFTTLQRSAEAVYEIIIKRWEIENNGFHQLKTYYNVDHCFDHGAVENIFLLNVLAFNFREMYLFKKVTNFRALKQTRINVTQNWSDDLLLEDLSDCFCFNSG